mmetsp:Transcript_4202/g.10704  ORF Transcript_4202/g.10704 Transcript_4202/m.10704 type:complete len:526 (+) Transcript_4202:123-1700(+)|eukprot:CAMPEP_0181101488 /NCGR_PEP_ID=MMETSP1071-20121207/13781_1 /TAXON_ID=35127 /ORGANISM="Thalassiosira sp., Strain NH16" /LENGTH=525 /DNA_ID=CAMNT_0023184343 /DNA_START=52 /DNA_END=1629 /DNA_ORIENTATION=+
MGNDYESTPTGKTGVAAYGYDDHQFHQRISNGADNGGESNRDYHNQGSNQSESDEQGTMTSDGKTSTDPNTNDDATSDECKPPSTRTEDEGDFDLNNDERDSSPSPSQIANKVDARKAGSFSAQLLHMLNSEADAGSDIVQWLPDGSGFVIRDQRGFEQQVLPRYFDSPCFFQSFVRRLYRWGFKQLDKSIAGSGHHVFANEVFHRGNSAYQKMKPIPRQKKEPQEALQDEHYQEQMISLSHNSSVDSVSIPMAAHDGSNALIAENQSLVAQGSTELIANAIVTRLPPQIESAQSELVQLMNTIVATYSSSPVLLSSVQNDLTNLLHGVPPAQLDLMQQHTQTTITNANEIAQSGNQEPVASITDEVIRFLTQRQGTFSSQGVPDLPTEFLPPMSNINTTQQHSTAPPLLPSGIQGCNPQIQQNISHFLLSNPNLQALWGYQAQLHQHALRPYGSTLPANTDSANTTASSSNDADDSNAGNADSQTSFSNGADESATAQATSSTASQAIPRMKNRKRTRSTSPDR